MPASVNALSRWPQANVAATASVGAARFSGREPVVYPVRFVTGDALVHDPANQPLFKKLVRLWHKIFALPSESVQDMMDICRRALEADNALVAYSTDPEDDRVVGAVSLQTSPVAPESALFCLAVHPSKRYRRKGIGERLVTGLLQKASERGSKKVLLEVFTETGGPAIALYRKLGFQVEPERSSGHKLHMVKLLD